MAKIEDLAGKVFFKLTVIKYSHYKNKINYWLCKCECGNIKEVRQGNLKSGNTKSCGCYNLSAIKDRMTKHSKSSSKEYTVWVNMRNRCTKPSNPHYDRYGGRGITICNEWVNSFIEFYKDMGDCPKGFTLERIENNKGYYKSNCKWASRKEQGDNRNFVIHEEFEGVMLNISEIVSRLNTSYNTYKKYRNLGYSADEMKLLFRNRKKNLIGEGIIENRVNKSRVEEINGVLMNRKEICKYFKISSTTMYRLYKEGFTTKEIIAKKSRN